MKHYLSKERLEELKNEIQRLKKQERQEIAERLKRAKEYGDLSENSEYTDAKEAQSKLESRIFETEAMIRNAIIIKKARAGIPLMSAQPWKFKKETRILFTPSSALTKLSPRSA